MRAAGVFGALGFFVEKFSVVGEAADGGRGVGSDLDEVEAFALSQAKGVVERHDAELLFGLVQEPDLAGADLAVAAMEGFSGPEGTGRERTQEASEGWR